MGIELVSTMQSSVVIRRVLVDRSLDPLMILAATKRVLNIDERVVSQMPRGRGIEAEVRFFTVGAWVTDDDLAAEYAKRELLPADPYSVAAVNIEDPDFADSHRHATHWKDADDRWCYMSVRERVGERALNVSRNYASWQDFWWYAGISK